MSQLNSQKLEDYPEIPKLELGHTIGYGGFGSVKIARTKATPRAYVAVKIIDLKRAKQQGIASNQIVKEAQIQYLCKHKNIIAVLDFDIQKNWAWMALELANNGELFDKIEPDRGVNEELAHFYFFQLINAIGFLHRKGVAHRDIKPENLVLDRKFNLKVTDFGLATVFKKNNSPKKLSVTACGSPPYIAPEVVEQKYDPEISDVWSCGIVLFVLLTGQMAWEIPHNSDPEFSWFIQNKGEVLTSPWNKLPIFALALLRKILNPDVDQRITIDEIKKHLWVNKDNIFLGKDGMCKDPERLSARLMINFHIDLSDEEYMKVTQYSATQKMSKNKMDTQPEFFYDMDLKEEKPNIFEDNYIPTPRICASQIEYTEHTKRRKLKTSIDDNDPYAADLFFISKDPASLQFSIEGGNDSADREQMISEKLKSMTLNSQKYPGLFTDSLTKFFSFAPLEQIILILAESLCQLGLHEISDDVDPKILAKKIEEDGSFGGIASFKINTIDSCKIPIDGIVKISKVADNLHARKVEFIRLRGDPLEWRRIFKRITILSREVVYNPRNKQK